MVGGKEILNNLMKLNGMHQENDFHKFVEKLQSKSISMCIKNKEARGILQLFLIYLINYRFVDDMAIHDPNFILF